MASFSLTNHISAPPGTVFEVLRELGHTTSETLVEGHDPGRPFAPVHGYTVQCDYCGVEYTATFHLMPDVWGTTVRVEVVCHPLTLMARIMSPLAWLTMKPMRKLFADDLAKIKQVAEERVAQSA